MKITEKTFDLVTGEETISKRDETEQEIAEREAYEAQILERETAKTKDAVAKAALLAKLGITADEAKLLLS